MRILTKHFGFEIGRPVWMRPNGGRWWDRWYITAGFGDAGEGFPAHGQPYRYGLNVDVQLLPNFIWWQDLVCQDPRVADVQVHTRIAGIQNWPFMRFHGWKP